jgi:hypothetical protein
MADTKISALTAATTPLAGTEVLPLVQSGVTKKVAVSAMFGSNVYTFLNTPTSANLAAAVTGETGSGALVFATSPTIDTPTSNGSGGLASRIHTFYSAGYAQEVVSVNAGDVQGWNGNGAVMFVAKINGNGRSINAGGTINALGTDYAEYMIKAGEFTIAKGDICGIDSNGKITNRFEDSIAFVVKSTNPSYVGGDAWGTEEALGVKFPKLPKEDASKEDWEKYTAEKTIVESTIEAARQKVDRIAFAGQVPVNVLEATPGQYVISTRGIDGSIKGSAISNPTFDQYRSAVGKVIAVESDGRARIIVKIS